MLRFQLIKEPFIQHPLLHLSSWKVKMEDRYNTPTRKKNGTAGRRTVERVGLASEVFVDRSYVFVRIDRDNQDLAYHMSNHSTNEAAHLETIEEFSSERMGKK